MILAVVMASRTIVGGVGGELMIVFVHVVATSAPTPSLSTSSSGVSMSSLQTSVSLWRVPVSPLVVSGRTMVSVIASGLL